MKLKIILGLTLAVVLTWSARAEACGCFAPPSPAEPIVQAGERILFAVKEGKVIAHIQIQYSGEAKDFGWLLPLPSVPTLRLGSDELFTKLNATTQPQYATAQVQGTRCPQSVSLGCLPQSSRLYSEAGGGKEFTPSPAVITSSIGPYDYAVLRADDKTAMLTWLSDNRYFVPAGVDGAVDPYIHPGSYFLALKLKSGSSSGDVTPVVLEYPSALPMIPLILTSVGATPNMGVQVFLLGNGRGIPRNYHHVVLNDALLDWLNGTGNYGELVTRAVAEAPRKHAFVTEYAATSAVMRDQLAPASRFGTQQDLASAGTPSVFVSTLIRNGFTTSSEGSPTFPTSVLNLLATDIPYPSALSSRGVSENEFYTRLGYYLGDYRTQNPTVFDNYVLDFDAPSLAQLFFDRYVTPLREANALFAEFPTLTRLFTTLSPEDMTEDPVFSFNAELPEVTPRHEAKLNVNCGATQLVTEQGWQIENPMTGVPPPQILTTPVALRVEVLGEEGPATVVTDNSDVVRARFTNSTPPSPPTESSPNGCSTVDPMSLGLLALMFLRRRSAA